MKKTIKLLALLLIMTTTLTLLVACDDKEDEDKDKDKEEPFYGIYYAELDPENFVEFVDKDTIKVGIGTYSIEGTYEINGDKITVTIFNTPQTLDFKRDGTTITIDGKKYIKDKTSSLSNLFRPNGKYVHIEDGSFVEFDGDNIKMGVGDYALKGTYKINGDKIMITIADVTKKLDYEKDGKTITIADKKYTKS